MFFDIHAHAYRAECPKADGTTQFATPDQVLKRYDELNIERGALLPLIGPETYLPQSNEDILDMCEASGGRFIPFCNLDPRGMTNSPEAPLGLWLEHYRLRGCKGIGEVMPNLPFEDPRCQNLFRCVEQAGLPLIFDISDRIGGDYGFYDDAGLPQLEATLKAHPDLIILGHGPAFWSEIGKLEREEDRGGYPRYSFEEEGAVPKMMRTCPNLYGDLSAGSGFGALARNRDYAIQFLNEFSDRLLFGTDICSAEQGLPLAAFLLELREEGHLSDEVFEKIARGNAEELLGV
ncbi:MAG: amidohydrolase family protein [Planctomycetota bacterium]|jgi:predicted TIM-barrel fold metal-dependent hydrolase